MLVRTSLVGTSPLLLHNVQLANPDNYWVRLIQQITKKRVKTEDDRREIARLEWFGSLYTHDGAIVVPTTNIRKCFVESAKVTKAGKQVQRAVNAVTLHVPLLHKGPKTIEDLWTHEEFRDLTMVGVGTKRTQRCRPIFHPWACEAAWELLTEVMDFEDFVRVAQKAGQIEGLGDNRTGGYGRFTVEVSAA